MNYSPTVLEIDANAIKHNLQYFKSKINNKTKILAVVKAFSYGSDAIEIAKLIQEDVAYFAVAYCHEGINLKNAGIKNPILVLHPQISNLEAIIQNNLEPSIYNISILKSFLKLTEKQNLTDYPIHIKFNTGLNRLGFTRNEIEDIFYLLKDTKSIKIKSIFSHLAASEDKNELDFSSKQISKFEDIASDFEEIFGFLPTMHMTNTSGILNYPKAQFDMVRLGIGLYGLANDAIQSKYLKNVLALKSVVSQINHINIGESVSYNRALIATKPMKTATIAIGHADGINRKLGKGKGFVSINNNRASIVGNVCMDMIMVDVTNINCGEGDEVIIFDHQETIEELAKVSETISYELITAISQRVPRKIVS